MKICYDQGYNDIRVVIATKWPHYLLYLQPYFSALFLAKFQWNLSEHSGDILGWSFNGWKFSVKLDNLSDIQPLSIENEALLKCNFTLKRVWKNHEASFSRSQERGIWLTNCGALVRVFVNILVYFTDFNKWMNNFETSRKFLFEKVKILEINPCFIAPLSQWRVCLWHGQSFFIIICSWNSFLSLSTLG